MESTVATIIIANYNGMRFLPKLRDSLRSQSERASQVIVVDDGSTDAGTQYIAAQWPEASLIKNDRNLGYAGTCNRGLEAARTPFVVLLNNDTHLDEHWLREGLAAFANDKIAGVASLVLLDQPSNFVDSAGDLYSIAGGAAKRCHKLPRESIADLSPRIFSACGASAFYRRDVLAKIGNLDAALGSYYDDVDIGFRLAWAGYECIFAPKSICYHRLSASYDPRGWGYHFNSARNAEIIWRSYMPDELREKYRWSRRYYLMVQAVHKLRLGCLRPFLAGRRAAAKMQPHVLAKQADLARFAVATPADIESRLYQDWTGLHLGRRRAPQA